MEEKQREEIGWTESLDRRKRGREEHPVRLGVILMASGWSRRFGRNKLLDKIGGKAMISYVMMELSGAVMMQNRQGSITESVSEDFHIDRQTQLRSRKLSIDTPVVVTRFTEVKLLSEDCGFHTVLHQDPDQSDTIRHGLSVPEAESWDGCMFVTGDQPMLSEGSILRLARAFCRDTEKVYRLSFNHEAGNPVIFPKKYFENLRNLTGDHGGGVLLKNGVIPSEDICYVHADREFELWDVDTEEAQRRLEQVMRLRY